MTDVNNIDKNSPQKSTPDAADRESPQNAVQRAPNSESNRENPPQRAPGTDCSQNAVQRAPGTDCSQNAVQRAPNSESNRENPSQRALCTDNGENTPQRAPSTDNGENTTQRASGTDCSQNAAQRASNRINIEEVIKKEGVYISTTSGVSMYPMLRDRRDTIVVTPTTERLKKYDVALYRRGDSYVLHRVIKVLPDSYVIRGDNCIAKERGITDRDILGKLTSFYRKDKEINMNSAPYKLYSRLICLVSPGVRVKNKILARCRRRKEKKCRI